MSIHRRYPPTVKATMHYATTGCDLIGTSIQESSDLGNFRAVVNTVTCFAPAGAMSLSHATSTSHGPRKTHDHR